MKLIDIEIPKASKMAALDVLRNFIADCKPRRIRTMREFAEQEIIIPDGPHVGRRFRCDRQPYTKLWLDEVDSGKWQRFVGVGPTQSGKTLLLFVVTLMYHLFEVCENVICGIPDMNMAGDKWREDIKPIILRTKFHKLIPGVGAGSRGGSKIEAIKFKNGATLKFMSGGGGDKRRSAFTSRVVIITEADGMDEAGTNSREADKITQIEARTRAFGDHKRIYMECTASIEDGRISREYKAGSESRIVLKCPKCRSWVTPERQHLIGWKDAVSELEAERKGRFICPECGKPWTTQQTRSANEKAKLLHRGQSITKRGVISGDLPETKTCGFRWSAVNNMFTDAGNVAADEWRASRKDDEDNAEREMCQYVWALPYKPELEKSTTLSQEHIQARSARRPQGFVPDGTRWLTVAIDIGKRICNWVAVASQEDATPHVVDYGRFDVPSDDLGVERAILVALRDFRDQLETGWITSDGKHKRPDCVFVDAGWQIDVIKAFCKESDNRQYFPSLGRGAGQQYKVSYTKPKTTGAIIKRLGEEYHVSRDKQGRINVVEVNSDHWKSWVHKRLVTPIGQPGAMTIYHAMPSEHQSFARQLTAEKEYEEYDVKKGMVITKWKRIRRQNHWFDTLYNACCAAHLCGARLVKKKADLRVSAKRQQTTDTKSRFTTPDGRPFLISERMA